MQVQVNGEIRQIPDGMDLLSLMEELQITQKVMAAAVNMEIVKKDRWKEHRLHEGDRVELLHFVGGG